MFLVPAFTLKPKPQRVRILNSIKKVIEVKDDNFS
jgi:hypothetical protein